MTQFDDAVIWEKPRWRIVGNAPTGISHFRLSHISPSYIFNGLAAEILIPWNTSPGM